MLEDVSAEVVADGVGVPAGGVQEALRPLRSRFAHLLGELPAVLALQASEQAGEVAPCSLLDLGPQEAARDAGMQLAEGVRPPLDGGEFFASASGFLRSHMPLLCRSEEQHTVVRQKCRCRTRGGLAAHDVDQTAGAAVTNRRSMSSVRPAWRVATPHHCSSLPMHRSVTPRLA